MIEIIIAFVLGMIIGGGFVEKTRIDFIRNVHTPLQKELDDLVKKGRELLNNKK